MDVKPLPQDHKFSEEEVKRLSIAEQLAMPVFMRSTEVFMNAAMMTGVGEPVAMGAFVSSVTGNLAMLTAKAGGMPQKELKPLSSAFSLLGAEVQRFIATRVDEIIRKQDSVIAEGN